jgi:integrase
MLLGGQRIAQLARLREPDINPEAEIIRLQDSKGRSGIPRDHLLPLTKRVRETLQAVPHVDGPGEWIFSTDGRSSLRPETVSVAVAKYSTWLGKKVKVKPFKARDLRRTCETRLAELGIGKDTRAQLLSHGVSGVQAKHYDRYAYIKEKREALERWQEYLDGLLDPGRKVVEIGARRKKT